MKKGQVSVFVIVAVLIVAGFVIYFAFRESSANKDIPAELAPVYEYYLDCIETETKLAAQIAGSQGGVIEIGEYAPGSEYAPFSSHLNFLGTPVKYWYYISANGVIKEDVPTESEIEGEMEEFIREGIDNCDFENFYRNGFEIERGESEVKVDIQENKVRTEVSVLVESSKGETKGEKRNHIIEVDSKLGKFYELAKKIYDKQKSGAFLEAFALDVLNLNAPVDGVELSCGPAVWSTQNVYNDIKLGLEENFRTIKFEGEYYTIQDKDNEYFVVDENVDEAVSVMYLKEWPTKIEIYGEGVDDDFIVAEAVGTQEGLGVMGFCYVPYHFVYDLSFPAMIQIYDEEELFQFPLAVIINKNVAREARFNENVFLEEDEFDLCEYEIKPITVNVYDLNLDEVEAEISYECFDQKCRIGKSEGGKLVGRVPACVNGYLTVKAENFSEKRKLYSSNRESFAEIILESEHKMDVELKIDGKDLEGTAIVTFSKENGKVKSAALPLQSKIDLSEGKYEVKVYVYGNTSISIPASSKVECVEVPKQGLGGFFGGTKEECFTIELPGTEIEHTLIGGGTLETFLFDSDLEKGKIIITSQGLPRPANIDDLASNFEIFETRRIGLEFEDG